MSSTRWLGQIFPAGSGYDYSAELRTSPHAVGRAAIAFRPVLVGSAGQHANLVMPQLLFDQCRLEVPGSSLREAGNTTVASRPVLVGSVAQLTP